MRISRDSWGDFVAALRKINVKAADEARTFYRDVYLRDKDRNALIKYAAAIAKKYGEASAALAATYYNAVAVASGVAVATAEPAAVATIAEVAEAVNGGLKFSENENFIGAAVGRLVKQAGADTMLKNAVRDRAEYAWIPSGGETCPYCLILAGNGWQAASKKTAEGGHASHIHPNCDCMFAVRFTSQTSYGSYDPDAYKMIYDNAEGNNSQQRINYIRRQTYAANADKIRAQQRTAYGIRKAIEESETT